MSAARATDLAALAWAAICAALLLLPADAVKPRQEGFAPLEDFVHGLLALVLAGLVWQALARRGWRLSGDAGAGLAVAYLVALELLQELVPGRGWEWSDVAFTVFGAALVAGWVRWRRPRERPRA